MIDFTNFTSKMWENDLRNKQYDEKWFLKTIVKYTNIDFGAVTWPNAGDNIYKNTQIMKHLCNNIKDINAREKYPNEHGYTLFQKTWTLNLNPRIIDMIIDTGANITLYNNSHAMYRSKKLREKIKNIKNLQLYLQKINPNNIYKNTSLNLDFIIILLWTLKHQKKIPNVVFKNKIILHFYL